MEELEQVVEQSNPTDDAIPSYIKNATRVDWILLAALSVITLYQLALLPFGPTLLVKFPFLNIFLTGGNFSVVALTATNIGNVGFIALVICIAAVSMIKFYPIWHLIGQRWGQEFIDVTFSGKPPFWLRKFGNLIAQHPIASLALAFVPFIPIPATIVVCFAGIKGVSMKRTMIAALVFSLILKLGYMSIGLIFGAEVVDTLRIIDRYLLYFSLVLLAVTFYLVWRRSKQVPQTS